MAVPYRPSEPDSHTLKLSIFDSATGEVVAIDRWITYDFASDFLTPTDSFSFTLGATEAGLPDKLRSALKLGAQVSIHNETNILATGLIDAVDISADRSAGIVYNIHGRDKLGQTLDAVADPTFQLKSGGTLAELLKRLFGPFGWPDDDDYDIDGDANRDARMGKRGIKTSETAPSGRRKAKRRRSGGGGSSGAARKLASFILHQTKPYHHESVFHFASRVAQRHGLWIWCSADGETLIVGKPDYKQEAPFVLHRGRDGRGNILSGSVHYAMTDQPTLIIADGFAVGAAGEFGKGRIKAHIINPMLGLTDEADNTPEVAALLAKHPGTVENTLPSASFPFRAANIPFRPMFLHDPESRTKEQLNAFVKREMSLLYRKALTTSYVVEGHGQNVDGQFVAWAPDTVVDVEDELGELQERMYVLGVAFNKSRMGGTTTRLELIRLNTIVL